MGRMLLAATELVFFHPFENTDVRITAPLDEAYLSILDTMCWRSVTPEKWING